MITLKPDNRKITINTSKRSIERLLNNFISWHTITAMEKLSFIQFTISLLKLIPVGCILEKQVHKQLLFVLADKTSNYLFIPTFILNAFYSYDFRILTFHCYIKLMDNIFVLLGGIQKSHSYKIADRFIPILWQNICVKIVEEGLSHIRQWRIDSIPTYFSFSCLVLFFHSWKNQSTSFWFFIRKLNLNYRK
jgi:hypothetical protein